jgi:hypothetical protein
VFTACCDVSGLHSNTFRCLADHFVDSLLQDDAHSGLRSQCPMWTHPDLQLDDIHLLVSPPSMLLMERIDIACEGGVKPTCPNNEWVFVLDPGEFTSILVPAVEFDVIVSYLKC